ncbi:sporulation protein YhbH [Desulfofundulus thermobenzoicus]|uniref:Sporulation protein YhbH n=1 Tax=Desulfofundulus thermobenzoicus TaxID=29376 RepID=A0A6N7IMS0_9FIRM|nr:sporulation protein YhbH [Desulfofundulus thermobenzoicus]MQL51276.1 sporulation protein YhbH [Desulfofundulus thermobenzoicus]HHW44377.1 sporulation protein YhbH [Desulfotomaculum sp.]
MSGKYVVSREDWSLHRKGEIDRQRHREKVREAIKKNLADVVSEESIIMSDGNKVVKIPIRSLDEYHFRFDHGKRKHAGQGDGKSKVGDVLGSDPQQGGGKGKGAGEEPGVDYYEADITIDELAELIFEDLGLPNLEQKKKPELASEAVEFKDVRKKGISSNIDRKRTIYEAMKRNALQGKPGLHTITRDDLRYRTWDVTYRYESNAVVLAMMDTSGSMGPFEKYIARSFFFWMVRFLRTKYRNVHIVFLAHHVEAKETTEEEFFTKGASGGTRCSSVYKLALEIIEKRYSPQDYNIYAFHFSDGDNLASDNDNCVKLVNQLLEVCNLVGYGEIEGPYYYTSTLRSAYKRINNPKFTTVTIKDKSGVYPALKKFFSSAPEQVQPQ